MPAILDIHSQPTSLVSRPPVVRSQERGRADPPGFVIMSQWARRVLETHPSRDHACTLAGALLSVLGAYRATYGRPCAAPLWDSAQRIARLLQAAL